MALVEEPRAGAIASVLESVIALHRAFTTEQRGLFSDLELTPTQLRTLYLLAHDPAPMTPSRLAARLDVTPGAVTQLIQGLQTARLVETTRHPDDARSRILRLQDAASSEVATFERGVIERLQPMFAVLPDDELRMLAAALGRIADGS